MLTACQSRFEYEFHGGPVRKGQGGGISVSAAAILGHSRLGLFAARYDPGTGDGDPIADWSSLVNSTQGSPRHRDTYKGDCREPLFCTR